MEAPEEAMERTSQDCTTFQMSSWANDDKLNAFLQIKRGKFSILVCEDLSAIFSIFI